MKSKFNQTLWQYLVDVYIPQGIRAGKLCKRSVWAYRCKVRRFLQVTGSELKLADITEEMLLEVEEELAKTYTRRTAIVTREDVRVILRCWNPDKFPDNRGGGANVRPQFADRELRGTLEQIFLDDFLPERTSIGSPQTIRQYSRCLQLFTAHLGHKATPADLTDKIVGKFLRWLVAVVGIKPITANGYVKQIKSLWTWLAKKRVVAEFPTVQKLKQPDPIPNAWSQEELEKLYAGCQNQVGFMGPVLANLFWTAFYLIEWNSGERTGAMLALRWSWLDMKSGFLTVPGEFRKGRTKSAVYQLKPETILALRAIQKPDRDLIFDLGDRRAKSSYFYRHHRQLVKSAGLPYEKHKCGPQKMRRSFASFIERLGGNATKALMHRDRRVTEDSYLDPRITEIESENLKLFPLDGDEIGGAA